MENYCTSMVENQHILIASRMQDADKIARMVRETNQLIGAPKKRTEAGEEAPMDKLARWLQGEDDERAAL